MSILDKLKEVYPNYANLLYEDKNDQSIVIVPVKMNDTNKKYIEYIFMWMADVRNLYEEDKMPTRPFTKSSSNCKYCPVKKTCWSKKESEGTITYPILEVQK